MPDMPDMRRTFAARLATLLGRRSTHIAADAVRPGPQLRLACAGATTMVWPAPLTFASDAADSEQPSDAPRLPRLDSPPPLRRILGGRLGRAGEEVASSISERLRSLRHRVPELSDQEQPPEPEPVRPQRRLAAEIVFTAGPRAGERLPIANESVALDRAATVVSDSSGSNVVVSIWPQGPRFMLRHNGGVVIGGARPALSVVTLDDGDEIAWGPHRMRFSLEGPAAQP